MAGQGFLILLNREDAKKLFAQKEDAATRDFVRELTQSKDYRKSQRLLELGGLWNGLQRCLTDGTLDPAGGEAPLNHTFLGGRQLFKADDYIVALVRPDMTPYVSEALAEVTYESLHENYLKLDAKDYGRELNEKDFEKLWVAFQQVRVFYDAAAEELSAMLFAGEL